MTAEIVEAPIAVKWHVQRAEAARNRPPCQLLLET